MDHKERTSWNLYENIILQCWLLNNQISLKMRGNDGILQKNNYIKNINYTMKGITVLKTN